MAKKNSPATAPKTEVAVAVKTNEQGIQVVDLSKGLPSLKDAQVAPMDLMGDYWKPQKIGESKNLFFIRIASKKVLSMQDNQSIIDLDCAFFLEVVNGEAQSITNGSRRLVGALEGLGATQGMAFRITYLGKKKNRSNGYESDNWSIKPLIISATAQVVEQETAA